MNLGVHDIIEDKDGNITSFKFGDMRLDVTPNIFCGPITAEDDVIMINGRKIVIRLHREPKFSGGIGWKPGKHSKQRKGAK